MQREIGPIQPDRRDKKRFASSAEQNCYGYKLKKDIVQFVVKQIILESGPSVFDLVNRSLYEKYRCEISDCFENPGYLVDVLRYVYDGSYHTVAKSIANNLDRFSHESGIKEFLDEIRVG
jgi:hypothetical protein